jgi:hypothetical protein
MPHETPYIVILNEQKCLFAKMNRKVKQVILRLVPVAPWEDIRKGVRG